MPQLPPNRQTKTIEELFWDVKIWWTPSRSQKRFFGWWIPRVSIRDMSDTETIYETNETLSQEWVENSNVKLIEKWSLLFSFKLTVGKVSFAGKNLYTNEAIAAFPQNDEINLKYLYYVLPLIAQKVDRTNNYWAPLLNKSIIRWLSLPLPPLPTQLRIVERLDEVADHITQSKNHLTHQLVQLDSLRASILSQVFSNPDREQAKMWDKQILEIIDWDRWKNYPKKSEFTEEWYCLFLNTSNVRQWFRDFGKLEFIDQERDELLRKWKTQKWDIILTTRWTIWNCAYIWDEILFEHIRINSWMVILRTNQEKILSQFLLKVLLSPSFTDQVQQKTSWSAQPQLPIRVMNTIDIPLPPLSTQHSIVQYLDSVADQIDHLRQSYQSQLDHFDELRASTLDRAFSWQLIQ